MKTTTIVKATIPQELWMRARAAGLTAGLSAPQVVQAALELWLSMKEREGAHTPPKAGRRA